MHVSSIWRTLYTVQCIDSKGEDAIELPVIKFPKGKDISCFAGFDLVAGLEMAEVLCLLVNNQK